MRERLQARKESMGKKSSKKDPRFLVPSIDAKGKCNMKIRFLPFENEDSVFGHVEVKYHSISEVGKEQRWIPKTPCPTTIGEDCPICEHGWTEWKDEDSKDKKKAILKRWISDEKYITNVMVIEDKENPENEGKVFLYEMGRQVFNNITAQSSCNDELTDDIKERDFLTDEDDDFVEFEAWDIEDSPVFHLKRTAGVKKGKGYSKFPSWGASTFDLESFEDISEQYEELAEAKKLHDLSAFEDEDEYPKENELTAKLEFLLYENKDWKKRLKALDSDIDDDVDADEPEDDADEPEEETKPKRKVKKKKPLSKKKKAEETEDEPEEPEFTKDEADEPEDELDLNIDDLDIDLDDI